MDFQLKMKEACQKFESLEEEHLAQMSTFVIKIAKVSDIPFSIESCSIYIGGWLPVQASTVHGSVLVWLIYWVRNVCYLKTS